MREQESLILDMMNPNKQQSEERRCGTLWFVLKTRKDGKSPKKKKLTVTKIRHRNTYTLPSAMSSPVPLWGRKLRFLMTTYYWLMNITICWDRDKSRWWDGYYNLLWLLILLGSLIEANCWREEVEERIERREEELEQVTLDSLLLLGEGGG